MHVHVYVHVHAHVPTCTCMSFGASSNWVVWPQVQSGDQPKAPLVWKCIWTGNLFRGWGNTGIGISYLFFSPSLEFLKCTVSEGAVPGTHLIFPSWRIPAIDDFFKLLLALKFYRICLPRSLPNLLHTYSVLIEGVGLISGGVLYTSLCSWDHA